MPGQGATRSEATVEQRFVRLFEEFLAELGGPRRSLGLQSSLERDLGLGSLERVELLSRLEGEFQVALPDAAVAEAATVGDVLRALLAAEGRPAPERLEMPSAAPLSPLEAPESAANLLEVLYLHARSHPQRPHVYLRQEEGEQTITYGRLAARACAVAAELRERGAGAGDRVALMLPTSEDFFSSFLGVLLAQAIPVPIYPPFRADRIEDYAARQAGILRNAEALMLITVERGAALARMLRPAVPSLTEVLTVPIVEGREAPWPAIPRGGDTPALIQYTSGSTGNPKGVLLTHANLLANIRAIGRAVEVRPDDSGVCWLPLYHDMGLIGCWLLSMYYGFPLAVMSPLEFLSRPERWLWAIHSHRATLSVGPNFAYDLCARKIRDEAIEGLDLSCWRVALNGSEAVRPETLERFGARFGPYGFRPEAMLPVYGLAESSVALAFPPLGRKPRVDRARRDPFEQQRRAEPAAEAESALAFVSVGRALDGHDIRIVDEAGQQVAERVEGRILFRGPSSMSGYFRQPEATAAIRHGDWLDSGDLGYWADGELFITGRTKDIILKTGRNLYPQEIESAVAELEGIRKGCVAAFGAADPEQGTEKLIVVAETREPAGETRERLRGQVAQRVIDLLGVPVDDVVLLDPGLLPKTSSGKLRRNAARQAYERGVLARRHPSAAWQWMRLGGRWVVHSIAQWAQTGARVLYSGWFYAWFVFLLVLCRLTLFATPPGRRAAVVLRFFTRLFLRLVGIRVEAEGLAHLEREPLVLVSNHASYIDPLAFIGALPQQVLFVAKKEALDMPLLGGILRKIGHLIVDRYSVTQSVTDVECIARALGQGSSVLVFAEGTFTPARGLRPFRLGAFKAAAEAGRPVAPVAIQGSRYVLPDKTWLLRRAPVRVIVRPPILPAGRGWREIVRLRDAAFAEILACCGEPRLDISDAAIPGRS